MKLFMIHVTDMNNVITMNESISIKGYVHTCAVVHKNSIIIS